MTHIFEQTNLWKKTLASQGKEDIHNDAREKLRRAFLNFREKVEKLATEIHRDLPDYTVHDITHLDALWEMADIIAGSEYEITPTEAFVLGGAILLHDLGMGLASYSNRLEDLKNQPEWSDLVTQQFLSNYDRKPNGEEIDNPPEEIKKYVIETLLRNLHAKHAEELASETWEDSDKNRHQLIEDSDLRSQFGRTIGKIAHSHWWSVNQLEEKFKTSLGSPTFCPKEWTVNSLKISCLLRVADASHIDERRAPRFLRSLRKPNSYSDQHWMFQSHLQKPQLKDDALVYTSGFSFPLENANSWWICFDTLNMIDGELRQVDALLADKKMMRFAARRVAGVESSERLKDFIPTENWLPVNAKIHIGNIPNLVEKLGGKRLYGQNLTIPLRELIQNAADSIRARRAIEDRELDYGEIIVRLGNDEKGEWLEVEDNGIGMSQSVLTKYLLDFGSSYWGSNLMMEECEGLLSKDFQPTGKFGIGFYSIFMLGQSVSIRTRRYDIGQLDTLVLEFNSGLSSNPILRKASSDEFIRDGGTCIRVYLDTPSQEKNGLLRRGSELAQVESLGQICISICPTLNIKVTAVQNDKKIPVICNVDWINCDGIEFLSRLVSSMPEFKNGFAEIDSTESEKGISKLSKNLRVLKNDEGKFIGRACIALEGMWLESCISEGGLKANKDIRGIAGAFEGKSKGITRNEASAEISASELSSWASDQADLVPLLSDKPEYQMRCAKIILACGGNVKKLPILFFREKFFTYKEFSELNDLPDELLIIDVISSPFGRYEGFMPKPNLVITFLENTDIISVVHAFDFLRETVNGDYESISLLPLIESAAAEAWKIHKNEINKQSLAAFSEYEKYGIIGRDHFDREVHSPVARLSKKH